jgi:hypothetical protein
MTRNHWILVVVLVAALAWFTSTTDIASSIGGFIMGKLTHTTVNDAGVIPIAPESLAAQMGTTVDACSLSRVVASETDSKSTLVEKEQIAVVALNDAIAKGSSITEWCVGANVESKRGFYGTQVHKVVSTAKDPTNEHLDIAMRALAGAIVDLTGGARKWIHPAALSSQQGVTKSLETIEANWADEGYTRVVLDEVNNHVFFYRKA